MCGIIGYTGPLDSKKILLNGLSQLEYRGYDSAGAALCMENSHICLVRRTGKVANLKETMERITDVSHCGLGHTRWATHGGVTTPIPIRPEKSLWSTTGSSRITIS